jgi:hypothetical protein
LLDTNNAIYDPFDGSFLGSLVAPDHNVQPEEHGKLNDVAAKNEELWSHLSRVLELQNQISRMHLDMEEIGMNVSDPKGKGKGTRSRATSVSRVVIDDAEGEEGIGGTFDEEAERNKAREEQFSNLSGQFRGKKEAINGIMTKACCTHLPHNVCLYLNHSLMLCPRRSLSSTPFKCRRLTFHPPDIIRFLPLTLRLKQLYSLMRVLV